MKPTENWTGPLLEHLIPSQIGSSFAEFHGGGFRVLHGVVQIDFIILAITLAVVSLTLKPTPAKHELVFDTTCPAALST